MSNAKAKLVKHKRTLLFALLDAPSEDLTTTEIEIMWQLTKDDDMQDILKGNTKGTKNG